VQPLFDEVLRHLPDRLGNRPRAAWLRRRTAGFGSGSVVTRGCRVLGPAGLVIGSGVIVARDVTLDARGGLTLEDDALIGFDSVLLTHTHRSDVLGVPIQRQGFFDGPVLIGRRAWLGARTLVLPGVTVGADAIVAAGAVVTADIPDAAIAGGIPARVLRMRAA
jgi:maltose O-acetyltransferase